MKNLQILVNSLSFEFITILETIFCLFRHDSSGLLSEFEWIGSMYKIDVGYLRSGFEYFSKGFAPRPIPTLIVPIPSRPRRALSIPYYIHPIPISLRGENH
jgi:hypothetical protein